MSFIAGTRITGATGGITTSITGYTVHTFSTPGVSTFIPTGNGTIEVLVVGGGGAGVGAGGGPPSPSGGGGGGAVIYNKLANVTSGTPYLITVGAVGSPTGSISSCTFNNTTIIANGGGAGGSWSLGNPDGPGKPSPNASGGGAAGGPPGGPGGTGAGVTGLGFPGGSAIPGGYFQPAGGGGAGGAGGPSPASGAGGIGVSYSITGTSQYYGGGAGGIGAPNGGLPGASYGTGNTPGAVIIRYPS